MGRSLSGRVAAQLGLCPGGSLSESLSDPPPLTVTSGRYASYWNAFLLEQRYVFIPASTNVCANGAFGLASLDPAVKYKESGFF